MGQETQQIYEFGAYRLNAADRLLTRDGQPVPLPPKAVDTLLVLLERHGHVVHKEELMRWVWPDTFVEEANLTQNISLLRKALGDGGEAGDHAFIETIPRRGYRFVAPVTLRGESATVVVHERARAHVVVQEETDGNLAAGSQDRLVLAGATGISGRSAALLGAAGLVVFLGFFLARGYVYPVEPRITSLAVLPLKPLGPHASEEYLVWGLADALITSLSGVGQITVRPLSAVRGYAEPTADPIQAGRDLGVQAVVEGNFQISGSRLRVTVRLLRVGDGVPLWSGRFDEELADIFRVQDSIAQDVTSALALRLTSSEKARLLKRYTDNAEAYKLYLLGRYYWEKRSFESLLKSLEYFSGALEKDPLYALGYAGMADAYLLLGNLEGLAPSEVYPKAKAAALKALELDPNLAEAHACLALVQHSYDWHWSAAEEQFRRAIQLNVNYANAHHWYAIHLVTMGRSEEALREIGRAQELDPLSLGIMTSRGWILYLARRYVEAEKDLRQALEMDPSYLRAHFLLGQVLVKQGRLEEAVQEFQSRGSQGGMAIAYALSGQKAKARTLLKGLQEEARRTYVPPGRMAAIHLALGEENQALSWLEKAFQERSPLMPRLNVDSDYDTLREHARFRALVSSLGLPGN